MVKSIKKFIISIGRGVAERGVQNWQKQLNNAQVDLNNLSDEIDKNNKYLSEAEESADRCAKSIDEYGKEIKEAGQGSSEFVDKSANSINQLAAASSNSNTNVGTMGETFKYAAPVAGALGYSIENTAVAIDLMANSEIKGSPAGTALRGVLTNLAKPSNTVAAYMDELGISLTDNAGNVHTPSDLMEILRERFANLTKAEKEEYAAQLMKCPKSNWTT